MSKSKHTNQNRYDTYDNEYEYEDYRPRKRTEEERRSIRNWKKAWIENSGDIESHEEFFTGRKYR